ncbi:hypothetical protein MXM69_08010 [Mammaliicoccus sciuri]|nr:hypothetical protein [Mammaliicoccus sciuri]MEB6288263.1 hypothetical protein [Mammaliicoccus sciuri]
MFGTTTKASEILGKAIALSGSYKLISEGNRSTIKNQSQYLYRIINST